METNLYSLKDIKSGEFMAPFAQINDATAIRSVSMSVNTPNGGLLYSNPEDIQVFCLGRYDTSTGALISDMRFVINAIDTKKRGAENEDNK